MLSLTCISFPLHSHIYNCRISYIYIYTFFSTFKKYFFFSFIFIVVIWSSSSSSSSDRYATNCSSFVYFMCLCSYIKNFLNYYNIALKQISALHKHYRHWRKYDDFFFLHSYHVCQRGARQAISR